MFPKEDKAKTLRSCTCADTGELTYARDFLFKFSIKNRKFYL